MLRTKKRMVKNVLAVMLALTLIFSMSATAFADETHSGGEPTEVTDPGTDEVSPPGWDGQEPAGDEDLPPEGETATDDDGIVAETLEGEGVVGGAEEAYVFPGMPGSYTLSSEERADKSALKEKAVLKSLYVTIAGEDYVEGEVVLLTDSIEYADTVAEAYGGEIESFENGVAVLALPDEATTCDAISVAADIGNNMPAVYPNFIYKLPEPVITEKTKNPSSGISALAVDAPKKKNWSSYTFNDPYLKNPNGMTDEYQWFHDAIGTYAAWGTTMGAGVTVAVLDTGIQSDHPDLVGTDNNGNPLVLAGKNTTVSPNTNVTNDGRGHGTHVAGIIAARANSVGGRGVAPEVTLLPVKVLKDNGTDVPGDDTFGTLGSVASGVNWVIDGGITGGSRQADIINMSLGGYDADLALQKVVANAIAKGIVVVASAGNDSTNSRAMPAVFPNVICVASSDMNNMRSNFSNYGPQVTIAAPGSEILSTYPASPNTPTIGSSIVVDDGYAIMGGTSMAAPMVSGAAALYISTLAKKPSNAKEVAAVKKALVKNATAAGSSGIGKIVNVGNMFNSVATTPTFAVKDGANTLNAKDPIPNTASVRITGKNFIVYTIDGSTPSVKNGEVVNGSAVSCPASKLNEMFDEDIPLIDLPVGKVTIKALCVNGQGAVSKIAALTITTIVPTGTGAQVGGMSPITGPLKLVVGKSGKYTAKVTAAASPTVSKTIEWSVDDPVKASINSGGTLTIKTGATGSVVVTAKAKNSGVPGVYSTLTVDISPPVSTIELGFPGDKDTIFVNGDGSATFPSTCTLDQKVTLSDDTIITAAGDISGYVSWSSNKPKIATVNASGKVTAVGSGKAVITAKATDGSGKSAKVTVNCIVRTESVAITDNSGYKRIASACSLTLKATTTPAKPTKGGVNWEIVSGEAGVTINASGKLTVPKTVTGGTPIVVKATAKDGYGAAATTGSITIVAQKAGEVKIHTGDTGGRETVNSKNSINAVNLFTVNPNNVTQFDANTGGSNGRNNIDERTITLWGDVDLTTTGVDWVLWSSNKPTIATVERDSAGRGVITAKGVGKATITCLALDGSGKKATCTVNVVVPASSMWVQGKKSLTTFDTPSLGFGKSLQMVAKPGSAYGKVSSSKVKWSGQVYYKSGSLAPPAVNAKVSVSASGKITTNATLDDDWNGASDELAVRVTAAALDGSGVVGTIDVDLCPLTGKMSIQQGYDIGVKSPFFWDSSKNLFYLKVEYGGYWSGSRIKWSGNYYSEYVVTSSNPKAVAIFGFGDYGDASADRIYFYPVGTLSSKITWITIKIVSNDGSGKSASKKLGFDNKGYIYWK